MDIGKFSGVMEVVWMAVPSGPKMHFVRQKQRLVIGQLELG